MDYLHKTLLNSEQIVYSSRPHWIVYVPSSFMLLIAIALYIYGPYLAVLNISLFAFTLYEILAIIVGAYGAFQFLKSYIMHHFSEYGITNKRVLMKTGWFERNSLELFLDKIEAVHIDQTIMGRLLGYGTVVIIGTGGSRDPFCNIPKPLHFRHVVQQEIDYVEQRHHS